MKVGVGDQFPNSESVILWFMKASICHVKSFPPSHCAILDAIASILQIDPSLRPEAPDVTVQLYEQAVRIAFDRAWEMSREMTALTQSLEGKVEREIIFPMGLGIRLRTR